MGLSLSVAVCPRREPQVVYVHVPFQPAPVQVVEEVPVAAPAAPAPLLALEDLPAPPPRLPVRLKFGVAQKVKKLEYDNAGVLNHIWDTAGVLTHNATGWQRARCEPYVDLGFDQDRDCSGIYASVRIQFIDPCLSMLVSDSRCHLTVINGTWSSNIAWWLPATFRQECIQDIRAALAAVQDVDGFHNILFVKRKVLADGRIILMPHVQSSASRAATRAFRAIIARLPDELLGDLDCESTRVHMRLHEPDHWSRIAPTGPSDGQEHVHEELSQDVFEDFQRFINCRFV